MCVCFVGLSLRVERGVVHLFPEMNDDLTGLGDASFFSGLQSRQNTFWRRKQLSC